MTHVFHMMPYVESKSNSSSTYFVHCILPAFGISISSFATAQAVYKNYQYQRLASAPRQSASAAAEATPLCSAGDAAEARGFKGVPQVLIADANTV